MGKQVCPCHPTSWLTPDGGMDQPGEMSKPNFARWLIEKL